jgi:hypothetical protein
MFIAQDPQILAARTAQRQGRVHLVLDLEQRVQHHGAALVQIDLERVVAGFSPLSGS